MKDHVNIRLRIPHDLHLLLKELSKKKRLSMHRIILDGIEIQHKREVDRMRRLRKQKRLEEKKQNGV